MSSKDKENERNKNRERMQKVRASIPKLSSNDHESDSSSGETEPTQATLLF